MDLSADGDFGCRPDSVWSAVSGITQPTRRDVFDEIEKLEEGDKVLMAWDYDPSTEGELGPMATAFARHCCEKNVKMYFVDTSPGRSADDSEGNRRNHHARFSRPSLWRGLRQFGKQVRL